MYRSHTLTNCLQVTNIEKLFTGHTHSNKLCTGHTYSQAVYRSHKLKTVYRSHTLKNCLRSVYSSHVLKNCVQVILTHALLLGHTHSQQFTGHIELQSVYRLHTEQEIAAIGTSGALGNFFQKSRIYVENMDLCCDFDNLRCRGMRLNILIRG